MRVWLDRVAMGMSCPGIVAVGVLVAACQPPAQPTTARPAAPVRVCEGREGCTDLDLRYERVNGGISAALLRKACDDGTATACTDLGVSYAYGIGVAREPGRAAALFKRACDRGSLLGCNDLGLLTMRGDRKSVV